MAKSCLVLCLSGVMFGLSSGPSYGARPMYVEVSLNGEVILEGGDSDGGERDADEIWEDLKELKLRETAAFNELEIAPDLKEYTFDIPYERNKPAPLEIDSMFGGTVTTRVLTIKRVTPDYRGGTWIIDSEDLDRLFDDRLISRYDARLLKDPKFAGDFGAYMQKREDFKQAIITRNNRYAFAYGVIIGAGALWMMAFISNKIRNTRK